MLGPCWLMALRFAADPPREKFIGGRHAYINRAEETGGSKRDWPVACQTCLSCFECFRPPPTNHQDRTFCLLRHPPTQSKSRSAVGGLLSWEKDNGLASVLLRSRTADPRYTATRPVIGSLGVYRFALHDTYQELRKTGLAIAGKFQRR